MYKVILEIKYTESEYYIRKSGCDEAWILNDPR